MYHFTFEFFEETILVKVNTNYEYFRSQRGMHGKKKNVIDIMEPIPQLFHLFWRKEKVYRYLVFDYKTKATCFSFSQLVHFFL